MRTLTSVLRMLTQHAHFSSRKLSHVSRPDRSHEQPQFLENILKFSSLPSLVVINGGSCCEKTNLSVPFSGGFRLWEDMDVELSAMF